MVSSLPPSLRHTLMSPFQFGSNGADRHTPRMGAQTPHEVRAGEQISATQASTQRLGPMETLDAVTKAGMGSGPSVEAMKNGPSVFASEVVPEVFASIEAQNGQRPPQGIEAFSEQQQAAATNAKPEAAQQSAFSPFQSLFARQSFVTT